MRQFDSAAVGGLNPRLSRRGLLRLGALIGAGAGASSLLGACGGGDGDSTSGGDPNAVLKVGLDTDATALVAFRQQGSAQMLITAALHRGLVAYDGAGKIVPAIAESYEQQDATFTFTLRSGVQFHDGSPVTAEVVKANLEFLASPDSAAKLSSVLRGIKSVTAPDERTVVVTLAGPDAAFLAYLADVNAAILPVAALGSTNPTWIGAGPFRHVSVQKGASVTVERFPGFFGGDAKLGGIEFHVYTDEAARNNALLSGELDMVSVVGWADYERVEGAGLTLDVTSDGPFMFLTFNTTSGPFADPRVRRAVGFAVNRENIVAAALEGRGTAMFGLPVPKSSEIYNDTYANHWRLDLDEARRLLTEAGYPNGFEARLLATSAPKFHQDAALSVQSDLEKVGIRLTLDSPDWAGRVERGTKGDYDIAVYGSVGVVNDPSSIDQFLVGPPNQNRSFGFADEKVTELIAAGRRETDAAARKQVYDQLQQAVLEQAPIVGLVWRDQAYGYTSSIGGFDNLPGFLTYESGYSFATVTKG
ncbi:ABC transporter substrate-binding protein [Phytohabitans kaempferiae]|uniref:ABC transporter substrate-binding protein n=1 Tax=Phytohabitans kaempferiae TaxID=1620943 RepID=A0ABV6M4B9_9ACTN